MLKETGVVTMLGRTSGDGSCTLISVAVRLHHNLAIVSIVPSYSIHDTGWYMPFNMVGERSES